MKINRRLIIRVAAATAFAGSFLLSSCNKKESETDTYVPAESVALTAFSISPDARYAEDLDSVYFAIDLDRGVVYNPDSLPKGTFVGRLIPVLTYPNTVASATFTMSGGSHRGDAVTDYILSPNDTIDFTGKVTLTLSNADGSLSRSYDVKVNVHKENPDSLVWTDVDIAPLPARMQAPRAQKTVAFNGGALSIIEEADGSFTEALCPDLISESWTVATASLPDSPRISTLTAAGDLLYMLDNSGVLFSSSDGRAWTRLDAVWQDILGSYGDALLGIRSAGGVRVSTTWPDSYRPEVALPDEFPVEGYSNLIDYSTEWSNLPYALLCGGRLADGSYSNATWAYDGSRWAQIAGLSFPPIYAPTIVNYRSYRKSSSGAAPKEFDNLMLIGGRLESGVNNRIVYLSYDNGVTWIAGSADLSLPDAMQASHDADALTAFNPMKYPLSDYWKAAAPRRAPGYTVEDGYVLWDCPYIFIFGGYMDNGSLNPQIYRGVLNRLRFAPLF